MLLHGQPAALLGFARPDHVGAARSQPVGARGTGSINWSSIRTVARKPAVLTYPEPVIDSRKLRSQRLPYSPVAGAGIADKDEEAVRSLVEAHV